MSRLGEWFRFDLDTLDDPEVADMLKLPSGGDMLKVWIAVLCTIYQSKGTLYRGDLLWEQLAARAQCSTQFAKDSVRYFCSVAKWLRYDPANDCLFSVRVNRELRDNFEVSLQARKAINKRWKKGQDLNTNVNPWKDPEKPYLHRKQRKNTDVHTDVDTNLYTNTVQYNTEQNRTGDLSPVRNVSDDKGSAKDRRPDPKGSASVYADEVKSWAKFKDVYPWDWSKRGKWFNDARDHWALMTPAERELAVTRVTPYAEGFEVEDPREYLINEYYKTI